MNPPSAPAQDVLDLSLFHVPVHSHPFGVEGEIDNREDEKKEKKRRFWQSLSRRVDLTGELSPVATGPAGERFRRAMETFAVKPEVFNKAHEDRWEGQARPDLTKTRDFERPPEVESALKETSVQFFLRNVPRPERSNDIELARPPFSYVEWTSHFEDYFAEVRAFSMEKPPMIEEFTMKWFPDLTRELRNNVMGFDWQFATDDFVRRTRGYFPFKVPPPPRISINDLTTQPAAPYRPTSKDKHVKAMRELTKLVDGTK